MFFPKKCKIYEKSMLLNPKIVIILLPDTMQFDPTYQSIDFERTEDDSADVPSFEKFADLPRGEK